MADALCSGSGVSYVTVKVLHGTALATLTDLVTEDNVFTWALPCVTSKCYIVVVY